MFRGTVEQAGPDYIAGWLYSEDADVSGRTILVFDGDSCVGSGRIDIERPDLKEAGLGHGRYGFVIPVPAEMLDHPLYLKMEGTDAILLAPQTRLAAGSTDRRIDPSEVQRTIDRYKWMCARGWISHAYLDFVKLFQRTGYYEAILQSDAAGEAVAASTLSDFFLEEVHPQHREVDGSEALAALLAEVEGPVGLIGTTGTLHIVEGGHIRSEEPSAAGPYIQYDLSPRRLVWVHPAVAPVLSPDAGVVKAFFCA